MSAFGGARTRSLQIFARSRLLTNPTIVHIPISATVGTCWRALRSNVENKRKNSIILFSNFFSFFTRIKQLRVGCYQSFDSDKSHLANFRDQTYLPNSQYLSSQTQQAKKLVGRKRRKWQLSKKKKKKQKKQCGSVMYHRWNMRLVVNCDKDDRHTSVHRAGWQQSHCNTTIIK